MVLVAWLLLCVDSSATRVKCEQTDFMYIIRSDLEFSGRFCVLSDGLRQTGANGALTLVWMYLWTGPNFHPGLDLTQSDLDPGLRCGTHFRFLLLKSFVFPVCEPFEML